MKVFFKELLYNVDIPPEICAEKVRTAVKGIGTDTNMLERILITRNELDMEEIRKHYLNKYGVEMQKDITSDTSGVYQKLLLGLAEK